MFWLAHHRHLELLCDANGLGAALHPYSAGCVGTRYLMLLVFDVCQE